MCSFQCKSCYHVARVLWMAARALLCGCQGVAVQLKYWYAVTRMFWLVTRVLLWSCSNVVSGCQGLAMQLLECCYAFNRVFQVVTMALILELQRDKKKSLNFPKNPGKFQKILEFSAPLQPLLIGCQGVAMQLLECCYKVDRVFWVVTRV